MEINKNTIKDLALDFIYTTGYEEEFADWVNCAKGRAMKKEKIDVSYIG